MPLCIKTIFLPSFLPFSNSEIMFFVIAASLVGFEFKHTVRERIITHVRHCLGAWSDKIRFQHNLCAILPYPFELE